MGQHLATLSNLHPNCSKFSPITVSKESKESSSNGSGSCKAKLAASLHPKIQIFLPRVWPESFNSLQKRPFHSLTPIFASVVGQDQSLSFTEPETALLEALLGIPGRGRGASQQQVKDVEDAVQVLEDLKGVPDPTSSSLIEGRWQLIFTATPGTALPIQRTFVGVDFFKVFQEVYLRTDDQRVSNIVRVSDAIGDLKVEVIDDLVSLKKKEEKGYDETLEGERQLVWAPQPEGQKWEATVANGLKGMQIVKKNGRLENLIGFSPGFRYHASGDLIYIDNKIRISSSSEDW